MSRRITFASLSITAVALALPSSPRVDAALISVPGDEPTIQDAIDAAVNGDEVVIAPGTYGGHIDLLGKAIMLRSTDPSNPTVVAATIVDGGGSGPVVTCTSGEGPGTVVQGLTIVNGGGAGAIGGGMIIADSSPTVHECVFSANVGTGVSSRGGAIHASGGDPDIWNCRFFGNAAQFGGAIYVDFGSDPTITGCEFDQNQAYGSGGGVYYTGDAQILGCTFTNNSCTSTGGGVYACCSSGAITNCTFIGNTASTGAGGYLVEDDTTVTGSTFNGNNAGFAGGGLYVTDLGDVSVDNCSFIGNFAGTEGGGLRAVLCDMTLSNSSFCSNVPDQTDGCYLDAGGITFLPLCSLPGDWIWDEKIPFEIIVFEQGLELLGGEDFEAAAVRPGGIAGTDDPLTVFTDDGVFASCDICSYMSFQSNLNPAGVGGFSPHGADGIAVLGETLFGAPDITVVANFPTDGFDIVIPPDPIDPEPCYPPDPVEPEFVALGFELCSFAADDLVVVSLFDENDALLGQSEYFLASGAPCTFIGVLPMVSTAGGETPVRISRVNVWSELNHFEGVSEVTLYGVIPCLADTDGDEVVDTVDTVDLLNLLGVWGGDPGGPPDFNGDGIVDTIDLLFLLAAWGDCP